MIKTQDRQDPTVGAVLAVAMRDCIGQRRLLLQDTSATAAAASHSPTARRCCSWRWALLECEAGGIRLQELAGELPHEASGQACCQSARAFHSPERADNPLAGRGWGTPLAETCTRSARGGTHTSRRLHLVGHDTAGFTSIIKFQLPDDFAIERALLLSLFPIAPLSFCLRIRFC
jgi:hypothetical protein